MIGGGFSPVMSCYSVWTVTRGVFSSGENSRYRPSIIDSRYRPSNIFGQDHYECEIHIRDLQNHGVNPDAYSSLLYPIILKSVPRDLSLEFTRKSYGQTENMISDLLDFLKIEVQCHEKNVHLTEEFNSYESNARKETRNYYNEKQNHKHRTDNKNDHSSNCYPKSIEERKLSLRKNSICYLCLTRGHIFRACMKTRVCVNCKGRHSELICDTSFIPANTPANPGSSSQNAGVRGPSPQCNTPMKTISCCNVNTIHADVLLETCRALLVNENRRKKK
ncbi:uncharacterized protein TNCV_1107601 [Trichonephila clavipes]|nr:uncharacterized protein TNCV_1107601 [Trichonephila clavipes]